MKKLNIENSASDFIVSPNWLYYQIGQRRFFKTDLKKSIEVSEKEHYLVKYGSQVQHFEEGESVEILKNGNTLRCFYQSSIIREFSPNGKFIREFPSEMSMMNIYDFTVDIDNFIWIVEPTMNRLSRFDYDTGSLIYSNGGKFLPNEEFNFPKDIISIKNELFISDMGNKRIAKVDIESKEVITYRQFMQPVWEYRLFKNFEVVRLENGVYILD